MTAIDLQQVVPTRLIQVVHNKLLRYHQLGNNLLRADDNSDLLQQLVASLFFFINLVTR
jgi:hypothetical protein